MTDTVDKYMTGRERSAAQIVLGLGPYRGMPTRTRYEKTAKLFDPNWKWENFRKDPLTKLLVSVYLTLERRADEENHKDRTRSKALNESDASIYVPSANIRQQAEMLDSILRVTLEWVRRVQNSDGGLRRSIARWGTQLHVSVTLTVFSV